MNPTPSAPAPKEDGGLVKRGLFLLALMGAMVVVLLTILLRKPDTPPPQAVAGPEPLVAVLFHPGQEFPAGLAWPALARLPELLPSAPGWEVRYNAAATLARRGSDHTPWKLIAEMLDEQQQLRNFRVRLENGRIVSDEAAARTTILTTLRAVADWHKKNKDAAAGPDLLRVRAAVTELAEKSPILEIQSQANNTRQHFNRDRKDT